MTQTDIRVAVVLLAALSLAGCSAPTATEPSGDSHAPSEGSAHTSAEDEAVVFPVGFPTVDVPMLEGELLHVAHPGNLWAAWIASDDLVADLASATAALVDAGYTVTTQAEGFAEFAHADRTLRIVASVDGTYGSCLAYTFTDGFVEAENAAEQDAAEESSEH